LNSCWPQEQQQQQQQQQQHAPHACGKTERKNNDTEKGKKNAIDVFLEWRRRRNEEQGPKQPQQQQQQQRKKKAVLSSVGVSRGFHHPLFLLLFLLPLLLVLRLS